MAAQTAGLMVAETAVRKEVYLVALTVVSTVELLADSSVGLMVETSAGPMA
jgi:hypothetical protein